MHPIMADVFPGLRELNLDGNPFTDIKVSIRSAVCGIRMPSPMVMQNTPLKCHQMSRQEKGKRIYHDRN